MSGIIKAIERHMILPARSGPESFRDTDSSRVRLRTNPPRWGELGPRSSSLPPEAMADQAEQPMQNGDRKLVAEWQRGAEILGRAQRKLRLAFAPTQSPALATLSR